jgi:alkanesulfonate monooxygenase SsuD/methylene tetrahydromethanopterin reductase-like flavin-dependent oxidoreductase (luciferase family)
MKHHPVSLAFDMRAPAFGTPAAELYPAAIEMARWADETGLAGVLLMEHHGSDDGYLPQPFTLGGAMAAVTKRLHLMLGAVILPLHDPVDIAEKIAVLDLVSKGRLGVILGAGYVPSEFAMFGKALADRATAMDEGIEVILRALKGERFDYQGRPVFVRPLPTRDPHQILLVGGGIATAARRAAKFDVGFGPTSGHLVDIYLAECEKLGQKPRRFNRPTPGMPQGIYLCEDAEEGWAVIAPHAAHVVTEYAKWSAQAGEASNSPFKGLEDPAKLRASGMFVAWTPDMLLERMRSLPNHAGISLQPLLGGLSPEHGWKSLKLLEQTLPRIRALEAES